MLKRMSAVITKPITILANQMLSQGVFPSCLKRTIIIPIHKKGSKNLIENYRPISILPAISKIFENILKIQLESFLNSNNSLSSNQHGYSEGRSTETALCSYSEVVVDGLDSKEKVGTVFLDLTKAFDNVDHGTLLHILSTYGIRGIAFDIFKDYLTKREQTVRIGDKYSKSFYLQKGVPQGSVLGPLLFKIYTNDIFKLPIKSKLSLFADDMTMTLTDKPESFHDTITSDLQIIEDFLTKRNMQISSKTKWMAYSLTNKSRPPCQDLTIHKCSSTSTCDCLRIEQVHDYKYLGVTVDDTFTWTKHANNLAADMRKLLRKVYFLKKVCPEKVMKNIYNSLCKSKIMYGLSVWGSNHCKGSLNRLLDKIQKSCQIIKVESLSELYHKKVLVALALSNPVICNTKNPRVQTNNKIIPKRRIRTSKCRKSYPYVACQIFNQLSPSLRQMFVDSPRKFINCIKQ